MSQHSNNNFSWIPRGFNPITKHSTPKTPEEENMYKKYVEEQHKIDKSFTNIFKELDKKHSNPILRNLLHKVMYATNTNRKNALTKYFNMINNPNKYNKSKKHQRNSSNSNNSNNSNRSNSSNSNNSNSNKSAKSAKCHKSNPKNL